MKCKNCQNSLKESAQFCDDCGAKVILKEITFKNLLIDFFITNFGVDSRFFLTMRKMTTHPEEVIKEYLEGVRRRYVNPFAFLAVAAGLSLIIFNYFADEFISIQDNMQAEQLQDLEAKANLDITKQTNLSEKEKTKLEFEKKSAEMQLNFRTGMWDFMLRYFNLLTFVFLLIYAGLSKWTFWKPHNYGEHVVINAYVYGFTTYVTLIAFLLAIVIHPSIYFVTILISILYYMYFFGRFYKLSIGKNILKLLRFFLGLLIIVVIFAVITVLLGFIMGALGLFK